MSVARTKKQVEADKLDLELFRIINALDRFANDFQDGAVREMAAHLDAYRHRIRRHMHPTDRAATGAP